MLRSGPYRFFFFSSDRREPVHIHVARDRKTAKFWLLPVALAYNLGFPQNELSKVSELVNEHRAELIKAWHDYFKSGSGNGDGQTRSSN